MQRCKTEYLRNLYRVSTWDDETDFLTQIAKKTGKLLKKGEPDLKCVAKMILHDWQRGRLPYFVPPPPLPKGEEAPAKPVVEKKEGEEGEEGEEELPNVKQNLKVPFFSFFCFVPFFFFFLFCVFFSFFLFFSKPYFL